MLNLYQGELKIKDKNLHIKSSHEIVHYYTLEFHPYKWYSPIQKKYALNGLRQ